MSRSFPAWIETAMIYLYLVTAIGSVIAAIRTKGGARTLFGLSFAVGLVPFVACAVVTILRLGRLQPAGTARDVSQSIHEVLDPLVLGSVTSLFFIGLHLAPHVKRGIRKRRLRPPHEFAPPENL